jgi:hypothetical protein
MNKLYGFLILILFLLPVQTWAQTSDVSIDKVFFAQHHVMEPDSPWFALTGNLPALIKVQVYSATPVESPAVIARLWLADATIEIPLRGPAMLPAHPSGDPVLMPHAYDDSFTATIPRTWIRPGLKVAVELRDYDYSHVDDDDKIYTPIVDDNEIAILDRRELGMIKVGAPTRLFMQMFDIHYFGQGKGADFPSGWETELAAKLPVSELVVHRVRNIMFDEIVMPPQYGNPSARYHSVEDYKAKTGSDFDGEQGIALRWCQALKDAGGLYRFWRPYHINIAGVYSGGQAGGYRSCGNLHRHGVLIHELGHTFGLPHWNNARDYPYKQTMYGQDSGQPTTANAGPVWAYDVTRGDFLSPSTLANSSIVWRKDPMQGGGRSNLKHYMYNHFSDYSVFRIRQCLEDRAVYWNSARGHYAKWNPQTGDYDQIVENNGVLFPIERDIDVISVLVTANAVVSDANIIYPPIGPYKGGLISRFDANSAEDRQRALDVHYTTARCNVALRITQGDTTRNYLTRLSVSPDDDPNRAFAVGAINLPARDGDVKSVELLYCPELMASGVTGNARTLYAWGRD